METKDDMRIAYEDYRDTVCGGVGLCVGGWGCGYQCGLASEWVGVIVGVQVV